MALCKSKSIAKLAEDFAHKTGTGRLRALAGLRQALDGIGTLESCEPKGSRPIIIWSTSSGLLTTLPGHRELTPDELQDACGVHYFAFGRLPCIIHARGLWAMSATRHCVGRYF
jgi:hypothetical protein